MICDVDGVLRHWASVEPIESANGAAPGTLFAAAFAPHRLLPAITGQVTDEQWRASVIADLADSGMLPAAARGLVADWSAMRPTTDEKVVALLKFARDVVPVALLSNATTHLEADLEDAGLSGLVDVIFNTSRIGFAKPDPRVYAHAAESLGVAPDRCLFVDDTPGHVEAARAAGMRGVHFRSVTDLEDVLRLLPRPGQVGSGR